MSTKQKNFTGENVSLKETKTDHDSLSHVSVCCLEHIVEKARFHKEGLSVHLNILGPPCTNKGVEIADSVHFNE